MIERHIPESKSEEQLAARRAEIEIQLQAEQTNRRGLLRQIEPLARSLRPLQTAYQRTQERIRGLEDEGKSIDGVLKAIERERQKALRAQSLQGHVSQVQEGLAHSKDPITSKIAQVLGMVVSDERFTASLPDLIEPDIDSYAVRDNSNRISIATKTDGVRMIICEDGDVAVIHHRPDPTVIDAVQEALALPYGQRVSPHFFGVRTRQQLASEAIPFVRVESTQDHRVFNFEYLVAFPMTAPALKPIASILSDGDISLRTNAGKLVIPRQPV